MPQASGLGDVRREARPEKKIDIPAPLAEESSGCLSKVLTYGICFLLVAAGTGVGLWAALN